MIFLAHQVGHTVTSSDFVAPDLSMGANLRVFSHRRVRPYNTFHLFKRLVMAWN